LRTFDLSTLQTLALATALFFIGQFVVQRSALLQRYSIPVPVVGGFLFALLMAVLGLVLDIEVSMDESMKAPLLLAFFATLGLGSDVRSLARGGRKLFILLFLFLLMMFMQEGIGLLMARLLDLHPLIGMMAGSISLIGGHGTAAAYASSFSDIQNIRSAMELGMAAATAGLILGSMLAGPISERLLQGLTIEKADSVRQPVQAHEPDKAEKRLITAEQLLFVLLVCLICIGVAHFVNLPLRKSGTLLPEFLWALLLGLVVRNGATLLGIHRAINDRAVQAVGSISLSLFLIMALMTLRVLDLATMAGPMLLIIVVNSVATAAFVYLLTFRLMGADYEAAVISGGHLAAGLATTAVGMSVMQTIAQRYGPAPTAFLLLPIVGAFFADISNALVVQFYLALPVLGF
jgi:ESS family glutamate:Na+ symporter